MNTILRMISRRDVRNQTGATMIEYALIAALIAVAATATMTTLGTNLSGKFSTLATKVA